MSTKEHIQAEIEHVSDEKDLDELYKLVKDFAKSRRNSPLSLMSKLRSISINGPTDFSANYDQSASREKRTQSDLH